MWKLSIGIIIGFVLLSLGLWGTHLEETVLVLGGWIATISAFVVWGAVIWWSAVGSVRSPL